MRGNLLAAGIVAFGWLSGAAVGQGDPAESQPADATQAATEQCDKLREKAKSGLMLTFGERAIFINCVETVQPSFPDGGTMVWAPPGDRPECMVDAFGSDPAGCPVPS